MDRPGSALTRLFKGALFVGLCLLCGELALRTAGALWSPASVLVAHHRIHDEHLGWRLNPDYPDVDEWCFRNDSVPEQADVVILGDSQTYGYGVPAELSWPRQLSALSGRSTYNIACSGYSPIHGLAIWEDVVSLEPQIVVAAVYAGNDLYDTFSLVYGHGQLSHLRTPDVALQSRIAELEVNNPLAEQARSVTRMGRRPWPLRDVLRDHSALFHFLRHLANGQGSAALTGRAGGTWEAAQQRARQHPDYLDALDGGADARTTLTVTKRLFAMDTSDPRIGEGLQMTLRALREMSQRSAEAGARLLVLWIPTKELVFAPLINAGNRPRLQRLIKAETRFQTRVRQTAAELGVPCVDTLPSLRRSLEDGDRPYPESADGHPTIAGYASIARVVADFIAVEL